MGIKINNIKLQGTKFQIKVWSELKKIKYDEIPVHERKRFGGIKKVNALKDGFLILTEIIKIFLKN